MQKLPTGFCCSSFLLLFVQVVIILSAIYYVTTLPSYSTALLLQQQQQQRRYHHLTKRAVAFHNGPSYHYSSSSSKKLSSSSSSSSAAEGTPPPIPHHVAIRTRNIDTAIQFYSLLGFRVETRFRAGPAKSAWLVQQQQQEAGVSTSECRSNNMRIELIEIPRYILQEPPNTRKRALDGLTNEALLGLNHFALDVTHLVDAMNSNNKNESGATKANTTEIDPDCGCETFGLSNYITQVLNTTSLDTFGKSLRIGLMPQQTIIGSHVYELAFIYDPDGTVLELLRYQSTLKQEMVYNGWEPLQVDAFSSSSPLSSQ